MRQAVAILATLLWVSTAAAQPLSAIDWLSDSVQSAAVAPAPLRPEPPVSGGATVDTITIRPLDAIDPDGLGLITAAEAGLAPSLWGPSTSDEIARQLAQIPVQALPAVQDQVDLLLIAQLDPPKGGGTPGMVFRARIDALLARGALAQADALLERADRNTPDMFRRAFDVALLTGNEDAACAKLRDTPGVAPSLAVRIFCLARSGDWPAASLTLETARALGEVSREEDILLARFLDPELAEGSALLVLPAQPTPLSFRMLEAIGEGLSTRSLPLAFSHADLRSTAGWKSRLEAAERLTRGGGLDPADLLNIYAERRAAASGSVWDRVSSVQDLAASVAAEDRRGAARALRDAWPAMAQAGLLVPLAEMFGTQVADLVRGGRQAPRALRLGLLSADYERIALTAGVTATDEETRLLTNIARGLEPSAAAMQADGISGAVARAFAANAQADQPQFIAQLNAGQMGEAILSALATLAPGIEADPGTVTAALVQLRRLGLEDTARRAALQLLILEPIT